MSGVVIVGASESGVWTRFLLKNLKCYGYRGAVWPINPGRSQVFGIDTFTSVAELPGEPELGVVMVGAQRALAACEELIAAGVPEMLVVSNGFKETGSAEGIEAEAKLVALSTAAGVKIVGPNGVGFARMNDHLCAIAEPIPESLTAGDVSLVSHSGAMLSCALEALDLDGLGIDRIYSIGNGAVLDIAAAIEDALAGNESRIVCAIVESLPPRERLAVTVAKSAQAGVHLVFLLLGQSGAGKGIAASHTGAVIGDGRLARAWLESVGVIVVDSVDEMARTTAVLSAVGRPPRRDGVMILSGSGGSAGLAADACARFGVPLARLQKATIDTLGDNLPPGAFAGNPLDLVAGMTAARYHAVCEAVANDQAARIVINPYPIVFPDLGSDRAGHRASLAEQAQAFAAQGKHYMVATVQQGRLSPFADQLRATGFVSVLRGLELTIRAIGNVLVGELPGAETSSREHGVETGQRTLGEDEGRAILADAGLPLVPGALAMSPSQAAALSTTMPGPYVVKIGNPGIAHKGRVGGVRVGLCTANDIELAAHSIAAAAVDHGVIADPADAHFLVQQMAIGPELLIGAVRDEIVGASVTVGIGGWSAEAGHVFFIGQLPESREAFGAMIERSALGHLLGSHQKASLAGLLADVGNLFTGPALAQASILEINPAILSSQGALCADVLVMMSVGHESANKERA